MIKLFIYLFMVLIGLIWAIRTMRNFSHEEKQYKERQEIRMTIIKKGIEEAKKAGIEIINLNVRKR